MNTHRVIKVIVWYIWCVMKALIRLLIKLILGRFRSRSLVSIRLLARHLTGIWGSHFSLLTYNEKYFNLQILNKCKIQKVITFLKIKDTYIYSCLNTWCAWMFSLNPKPNYHHLFILNYYIHPWKLVGNYTGTFEQDIF